MRAGLATLLCAAVVSGCAPTHSVRPYPEFVTADVRPGDTVIVETSDGKKVEFAVERVSDRALRGGEHLILLEDVVTLQRVGWRRPVSPCGGAESMGCSVPFLVQSASDFHGHYSQAFHEACVQHDYCYRHGHASYGHDRRHCDEAFLADMQALCPPPGGLGLPQGLDGVVRSRTACLATAKSMYRAVREHGEEHFLGAGRGTACYYDGPPAKTP